MLLGICDQAFRGAGDMRNIGRDFLSLDTLIGLLIVGGIYLGLGVLRGFRRVTATVYCLLLITGIVIIWGDF